MRHSRFRHTLKWITLIAIFFGFTSCIYDYLDPCEDSSVGWFPTLVEAEYETDWYIPVTPRKPWETDFPESIGTDQSKLRPQIPSGLRIISYPDKGELQSFNLPPHGGNIDLHSLSSHLLFYNNDTEYIIINPKEGFDSVTATTRQHSQGTYKGNPKVGTVANPQPVYSSPDMLFRASIADYDAEKPDSMRIINIELLPAVFTYVVHFAFDSGLDYVQSARGAITGMARGVLLSSGKALDDGGVTLLYDCEKEGDGMTGIVKSFGLPGYTPQGEPIYPDRRYGITLQTYLRNGKMLTFDFDVTSQVAVQPYGGVIMVNGVAINDSDGKPEGGNGAFDVDVNPWGPSDDIDIM